MQNLDYLIKETKEQMLKFETKVFNEAISEAVKVLREEYYVTEDGRVPEYLISKIESLKK